MLISIPPGGSCNTMSGMYCGNGTENESLIHFSPVTIALVVCAERISEDWSYDAKEAVSAYNNDVVDVSRRIHAKNKALSEWTDAIRVAHLKRQFHTRVFIVKRVVGTANLDSEKLVCAWTWIAAKLA